MVNGKLMDKDNGFALPTNELQYIPCGKGILMNSALFRAT